MFSKLRVFLRQQVPAQRAVGEMSSAQGVSRKDARRRRNLFKIKIINQNESLLYVNHDCGHVFPFIFDQSSLKSHETKFLMTLINI